MSLRVDKFVWFVRLSKTRSIASDHISKGRVKLNGENVKPSKTIKVGDVVSIHKNNAVFSYKVLELLDRRVGAKLVENYILDITDPIEIEKYKTYLAAQKTYRHFGDGKPTKKDRRDLDDFLSDW